MVIPALAFLEACPGIGLFVSGVILLSVSTFLYVENLVSLPVIVALAFIGATLSDHLGFYLGRLGGPSLRETSFIKRRVALLDKSESSVKRYGMLAIVIGRLMTAVRSLIPMIVGINGFGRLRFTLADWLACGVWSAGLAALVTGIDRVIA